MIGGIIGGIVSSVANNAVAEIGKAFQAHANKTITLAELEASIKKTVLDSFTQVEKATLEALAKTWDSFMNALPKSKLMQVMWASAVGSQIFVLFWSQWVVPMLHMAGWIGHGWRPGATAEWAYLLLGGLMGLGPLVLRAGPGAGNIAEQLKALVKK